jgi:hypothetical protein
LRLCIKCSHERAYKAAGQRNLPSMRIDHPHLRRYGPA